MTVKIRLKEVRQARGISQNQLARKLEMSVANIKKIEGNVAKSIPFTTLDALCEALECLPGDLFEYIPKAKKET